ncbi:biotin/lipoyl-containing protein [Bacillota bacterium Meth-B3]|nr:biotin/lipoyl-containing protein [Christensenellaceae bacterium]MEA5067051.1 biotin/lipoyl-containing protein [Eubacteriales bacterium]MEA5069971.1 biotin/lipoyl-containing protein [Christensenellaceae bacterium]
MHSYKITVNGQAYEVEVEEVGGFTGAAETPAAPAKSAPAPAAKPAAKSAPAGAETIKAPMPGTILAVNVQEGSSVKKGQVVLVLEAMKMENEIMSPRDGVVGAVLTSKGSSVNTGDALVALK